MKKTLISLSTLVLLTITFSACSKEPQEPYFDRAKSASEKAHAELERE